MEISGDENTLSALAKKIEDQDKELLELFPWFEITKYDYGLWKDTLSIYPTLISFSYGSKWAPPEKQLYSLVDAYPTLTFKGTFEEPSMEIFGKITGEKGSLCLEYQEPLEYFTEYYENFAEERELIENGPYKDFLNSLLENSYDDYSSIHHYLEPLIVRRLKDEDLPLFINKNWITAEKMFQDRFKRVNHETV